MNELVLHGRVVLQFTYADVVERGESVVRTTAAALAVCVTSGSRPGSQM